MEISKETLQKIVTGAKSSNIDKYLPWINKLAATYGINTPLRMQHFIAQIAHESGSFNYVEEIASGKAYEGRKDLGNMHPGDGVKYKGRGLIQITGEFNYITLSKVFGVDLVKNPDFLEKPEYAVRSAMWYWLNHGLNTLADRDDIKSITKRINGGLTGLASRQVFLNRAKIYIK